MRIVDANVLLYAVNGDARHHHASRAWLDDAVGGADSVGLTWIAALAFLRLSTSPAIFARPLTTAEAVDQLDAWSAGPGARWLEPTAAHTTHLARLLADTGAAGNLADDAHLAALAIEYRADVVSYDNDFSRFAGVRWRTPDDLLARSRSSDLT